MKTLLVTTILGFVMTFVNCPPNPNPNPTPTPTPAPAPHEVVQDKELIITDLAVVNSTDATDPNGAFSIKTLLTDMAPQGQDAKGMMLSILNAWKTQQTVNSFNVPARNQIDTLVIKPWKAKDGQPNVDDAQWNMNFANAPFRLLAIVNRIDLHHKDASTVHNAGEGRFVFGVLDNNGNPLQFTIIFEYEQKAKTEAELKQWAVDWHNLGTFQNFDASYLTALKTITAKFAGKNAMPNKPNGSALNQLRTNEIALNGPWELRELHLSTSGGLFETATTRQTPHDSFNNSPRLADLINQNSSDIIAGNFEIPMDFPAGQPFRGANPQVTSGFWRTPTAVDPNARHMLSLNTCNACHGRETNTGFLHVTNRAANARSNLSGFLTGITVNDPIDNTPRTFNDLAARVTILKTLTGEAALNKSFDDALRTRAKRVH